jgi:hypothetical protein
MPILVVIVHKGGVKLSESNGYEINKLVAHELGLNGNECNTHLPSGKEWLRENLELVVNEVARQQGTDTRGAIRDCITDLLILAEKDGMDEEQRIHLVEGAREVMTETVGVPAVYISDWDNGASIRSKCRYFPDLKVVRDIEGSDSEAGDDAQLVSESVELADGTTLGAADDVEFEY